MNGAYDVDSPSPQNNTMSPDAFEWIIVLWFAVVGGAVGGGALVGA